MATVTVERTYLEISKPPTSAVGCDAELPAEVDISEQIPCDVATYRSLYAEVGRAYHWRDRLAWSDEVLAAHLQRPDIRIWILRDADGVGGYFELAKDADGAVEIAYFGLFPTRHGRGLGKALLTRAIAEGWRWGATRLWLHTCTLDGPTALPNYRARGFVPFRRETYEAQLPDR